MKKIPTLFKREFEGHKIVGITPEIVDELKPYNLLDSDPLDRLQATIKWDGACCLVRWDGTEEPAFTLYKRYDAKHGKPVPENAIPCCDRDPVTGHQPCWMPCDRNDPADKWFYVAFDAYINTLSEAIETHKVTHPWYKENTQHIGGDWLFALNGAKAQTCEAVGPHFQGNPYGLESDILIPHGRDNVKVALNLEGIKQYLTDNYIEGLVFWCGMCPVCKIKRTDFGLEWNGKNTKR